MFFHFRLPIKCRKSDTLWTEHPHKLSPQRTLYCCGMLHRFPGPTAADFPPVCRSKPLSPDLWNRHWEIRWETDTLHLYIRCSRSLPSWGCRPNWVRCLLTKLRFNLFIHTTWYYILLASYEIVTLSLCYLVTLWDLSFNVLDFKFETC